MSSFLDWLLEGDTTGELHAIVEADRADEAAGITWGVYDGDRLVESTNARWRAECIRADNADATDRPISDYTIRPVVDEQTEVAA